MTALAFSTYHFDLKNDGSSNSVTLTPTTADTSATFTIQGVSGALNGAYKRATAIAGRLRVGFDQAASGGATVNWDQLPRVISGLEINSPLFGLMASKESTSGPVLKHLIEFVGQGYRYGDAARAQIAAADGDTAVDLYFCFPLAQQCLVRPHDCTPWVGWLDKTQVTFSLGSTTALDAVSTGAVIEATTNVQMWCEYHVDNDLELPAIPSWQLYQRAAASANSILIEGMGAARGIRNVENFDRLAGLFWHMDVGGFGGPDGADNITELYLPALGIDRTINIDAFFRRFRSYAQRNVAHVGGNGTSALHDSGSNGYESMAAAVNSTLNSSTAMYLPIVAPSPAAEITKMPKIAGDIELTARFTSTPSSGLHKFTAYTFKSLDKAGRAELLARAGKAGAAIRTELADGTDLSKASDWSGRDATKYNNPRRFLGLPASVVKQG